MSVVRLREPGLEGQLRSRVPLLWLNDGLTPARDALARIPIPFQAIEDAERRLERFAPLLSRLFPELEPSRGIIESPLLPVERLKHALEPNAAGAGRWFVKADHALPVAGSIKARGGLYEVLLHAERLATERGLLGEQEDRLALASSAIRALFREHTVSVGSTGNLGLSIGIMAAALGFRAVVHMSADAKPWKVERLRRRGVEVVEHRGDFGDAVAAGRELAAGDPRVYFVDDENSWPLFLGYSVAALRLQRQLAELQVAVDATHPLFVYLPCGVGGSPGGITFGLKHVFGDHVHCFFAEPVASPCMLIRLASADDVSHSVRDLALDNQTEADGLAVARASELVVRTVRELVSGVYTVPDRALFELLHTAAITEQLELEPSATAGFAGPRWLIHSPQGREYAHVAGLVDHLPQATHLLWTTGGSFVPHDEYQAFFERGRQLKATPAQSREQS